MSTKSYKVDTSKPVLVSGATGYIAGVIIQQLLEKGVCVHATVRDPSKKERFQYLQDAADKSPGSIKFFKGDLLTPGSFDEGMKGCSIVFHTASPYVLSAKDPYNDLVAPAVKGTENVLLACNKSPSVKKVVVTSSCVAIFSDASEFDAAKPTDEETWNRTASLDYLPYPLSKTLAEQKAWVIAGSQTQWKMCTINPSAVFGPGLKCHESSESFALLKSLGSNDPNFAMGVPAFAMPLVDVREVASAHLAAAYLDDTSGRYILSGHDTTMSEMAIGIGKKYAEEYPIVTTTLSYAFKPLLFALAPYMGAGVSRRYIKNSWGYMTNFDNSKSRNELGIEYRPMEETVQEMYQQLIEAGVVSKK